MFDVRRSVRRTVGHPSFSNVAMDRPTVHGPRRSSREAPQCYSLVNTRFLFSVAALEPSAHRRRDERGSRDTRTTPLAIAAPLASHVTCALRFLFSVAALEPSAHRRRDERGSKNTRTTPLAIAAPLASHVTCALRRSREGGRGSKGTQATPPISAVPIAHHDPFTRLCTVDNHCKHAQGPTLYDP